MGKFISLENLERYNTNIKDYIDENSGGAEAYTLIDAGDDGNYTKSALATEYNYETATKIINSVKAGRHPAVFVKSRLAADSTSNVPLHYYPASYFISSWTSDGLDMLYVDYTAGPSFSTTSQVAGVYYHPIIYVDFCFDIYYSGTKANAVRSRTVERSKVLKHTMSGVVNNVPIAVNNVQEFTPTGNYNLVHKKYVDDAIAAASGSTTIPTITLSVTQIVSQDPIEISMTQEQQTILENTNNVIIHLDATSMNLSEIWFSRNHTSGDDLVFEAIGISWGANNSGPHIEGTRHWVGIYNTQTKHMYIINTPYMDSSVPTADAHLTNKKYVDDSITELTTTVENTVTNSDIDSLFN